MTIAHYKHQKEFNRKSEENWKNRKRFLNKKTGSKMEFKSMTRDFCIFYELDENGKRIPVSNNRFKINAFTDDTIDNVVRL